MWTKKLPKLIAFTALTLASFNSFAQTSLSDSLKWAFAKIDSLKTATAPPKTSGTFTISLDFRPRTEFRHGYRTIPTKDTIPSFLTSHRARINFDYKSKILDVAASLQDVRVWGQYDPRSTSGTVQIYEFYAEPHITNKFSARIGRQKIMYDNQRLYAENDWRQSGGAHDAFRLIYNNKINFSTELAFAYNQSVDNPFNTVYKPTGFSNYKSLLVHYLNYKISNKFTLTTINTMDGYQSTAPNKSQTVNNRYTVGGRLEYASYDWYLTFSGYYQFGKDSNATPKNLAAYYIQPEIKYTGVKNFTFRLGMEYLSGDDGLNKDDKDHNFVPLYGVAHRFMGNLDFFTTFPSDVNKAGLVNPYLFIWYAKNKFALRFDHHLFYSQNNFVPSGQTEPINKYLGYENDWRLNYKPVSYIDIEFGFCWAIVTNSMTTIKKSGSDATKPYWSYVSFRFTPTLGKFSF